MTREAFNDIIHNQYRRLYIIAFRILKNQQEAEDVIQEVFMKMWIMKEKLDNYEDHGALAVTITRNRCFDLLRKWKHIDNDKDGTEVRSQELSPSPHDQMINSETNEILNEIINNLPENFKNVIRLRDIQGLEYEEIASLNDININTLRVTLSRARKIVREKYLKYTYERGKTETITGPVL
jgi:RNA polymerase sigma factor (sigma-70 family)